MILDLERYRSRRKYTLSLRERIAQARRNQGLTQEQVAKKVGCDRSVISKWENGILLPHPEDLVALATTLHAPDLLEYYCSECAVCKALLPKPAA